MVSATIVHGLLLGGTYSLIALGVVIVYKSSKIFNMAHGEIMMLFAYLFWWLLSSVGLPLWAVAGIVVAASAFLGWALNHFVMRQMISENMLATFMLCLLLGIFIKGATTYIWGGVTYVMPEFLPTGTLDFAGVTVSHKSILCFGISMAMFILFVAYFRLTTGGLDMRCVSEDHAISQSLGLDVHKIFGSAWVIGCIIAAVSGVLWGSMFVVDSDLGSYSMIKALPVLLLGGLGSIPGAFVGGLFLGTIETISAVYIDPRVMGFSELVPSVLMVLILMIRPQGLFGEKRIERI